VFDEICMILGVGFLKKRVRSVQNPYRDSEGISVLPRSSWSDRECSSNDGLVSIHFEILQYGKA
jgi:hypothetical protein